MFSLVSRKFLAMRNIALYSVFLSQSVPAKGGDSLQSNINRWNRTRRNCWFQEYFSRVGTRHLSFKLDIFFHRRTDLCQSSYRDTLFWLVIWTADFVRGYVSLSKHAKCKTCLPDLLSNYSFPSFVGKSRSQNLHQDHVCMQPNFPCVWCQLCEGLLFTKDINPKYYKK